MNISLLLSASDCGGARNLGPLVDFIQLKGIRYTLFVSKTSRPIFNVQNNLIEQSNNFTLADAIEFLCVSKPDVVICGTTRFLSPDRLLIAAAKKLSIKTIVILDEWFNYRMRFENKKGELVYLPDIICCQDDKACQEAIAEGIPSSLLLVTGSPSLAGLRFLADDFLKNPPPKPLCIANKNRPVVTFLSEPFSVNYGTKQGEKGPLGEFVGYTENIARKDLFDALSETQTPCTVIEKLHPTTENRYSSLRNEFIDWVVIQDRNLWPLLWYSNLVVGMRSMALLEAAILGCDVVSYQPNLIGPQLCAAVRYSSVADIRSKEQFYNYFKQKEFKNLVSSTRSIRKFPFSKGSVLENILNLVLDLKKESV